MKLDKDPEKCVHSFHLRMLEADLSPILSPWSLAALSCTNVSSCYSSFFLPLKSLKTLTIMAKKKLAVQKHQARAAANSYQEPTEKKIPREMRMST